MKRPEDWLMAKAFNLYSDLVPEPSRAYLEMLFSKDVSKSSIPALAVSGWWNHLPWPNVWNCVWGRMDSPYQNISWMAWNFLWRTTVSVRNCLSHIFLLNCRARDLIANLIPQSLKRECSIWMMYLHGGSLGYSWLLYYSCGKWLLHIIAYYYCLFIFQCFTN